MCCCTLKALTWLVSRQVGPGIAKCTIAHTHTHTTLLCAVSASNLFSCVCGRISCCPPTSPTAECLNTIFSFHTIRRWPRGAFALCKSRTKHHEFMFISFHLFWGLRWWIFCFPPVATAAAPPTKVARLLFIKFVNTTEISLPFPFPPAPSARHKKKYTFGNVSMTDGQRQPRRACDDELVAIG